MRALRDEQEITPRGDTAPNLRTAGRHTGAATAGRASAHRVKLCRDAAARNDMRAHAKAMSWLGAAVLAAGLAGCAPLVGELALDEALLKEGARYEASATGKPGRPPELDKDATLPDYLAYAAVNNPGLEAAFHRWRAAGSFVPQARALPDPRLSFGWFIREVETRVGAQRAKIGVSQMFPWKGKRSLRGEVALHAAEAAHARYEAVKLTLFHRVKRTYWRYWFLSRAVAVTEETVKLLGQLESVARARYAAGSAPQSAVVKAQLELGRLEDRLKALRDLRGFLREASSSHGLTLPRTAAIIAPKSRPFGMTKMQRPPLRSAHILPTASFCLSRGLS